MTANMYFNNYYVYFKVYVEQWKKVHVVVKPGFSQQHCQVICCSESRLKRVGGILMCLSNHKYRENSPCKQVLCKHRIWFNKRKPSLFKPNDFGQGSLNFLSQTP